jgi:sterol desaturase/sphingolipid hydroxylase (fatty acid hydroxylase superfamily)
MGKMFISNKDETARIFKSDFFEMFSKVHPSVPLIIYVPVITYFLYRSYYAAILPAGYIIGLFLAGTFIWTLTEYLLHRFIFHYDFKGDFGRKIHFIFHGIHHAYPKDSKRLVMPPSVSIPLAILFYYLYLNLFGDIYVDPFFAGFLTGYLFYDMTHYAIHHFNINGGIFLTLKKHHMKHHYMNAEKGFGVSQPVWDYVYKTNFEKPERTNE